jgi:hypothetical protein
MQHHHTGEGIVQSELRILLRVACPIHRIPEIVVPWEHFMQEIHLYHFHGLFHIDIRGAIPILGGILADDDPQ